LTETYQKRTVYFLMRRKEVNMAEISEISRKLAAETADAPEEVQKLAGNEKLAEALSELQEDQPAPASVQKDPAAWLRSKGVDLPEGARVTISDKPPERPS
jgi:hypothetical protein